MDTAILYATSSEEDSLFNYMQYEDTVEDFQDTAEDFQFVQDIPSVEEKKSSNIKPEPANFSCVNQGEYGEYLSFELCTRPEIADFDPYARTVALPIFTELERELEASNFEAYQILPTCTRPEIADFDPYARTLALPIFTEPENELEASHSEAYQTLPTVQTLKRSVSKTVRNIPEDVILKVAYLESKMTKLVMDVLPSSNEEGKERTTEMNRGLNLTEDEKPNELIMQEISKHEESKDFEKKEKAPIMDNSLTSKIIKTQVSAKELKRVSRIERLSKYTSGFQTDKFYTRPSEQPPSILNKSKSYECFKDETNHYETSKERLETKQVNFKKGAETDKIHKQYNRFQEVPPPSLNRRRSAPGGPASMNITNKDSPSKTRNNKSSSKPQIKYIYQGSSGRSSPSKQYTRAVSGIRSKSPTPKSPTLIRAGKKKERREIGKIRRTTTEPSEFGSILMKLRRKKKTGKLTYVCKSRQHGFDTDIEIFNDSAIEVRARSEYERNNKREPMNNFKGLKKAEFESRNTAVSLIAAEETSEQRRKKLSERESNDHFTTRQKPKFSESLSVLTQDSFLVAAESVSKYKFSESGNIKGEDSSLYASKDDILYERSSVNGKEKKYRSNKKKSQSKHTNYTMFERLPIVRKYIDEESRCDRSEGVESRNFEYGASSLENIKIQDFKESLSDLDESIEILEILTKKEKKKKKKSISKEKSSLKEKKLRSRSFVQRFRSKHVSAGHEEQSLVKESQENEVDKSKLVSPEEDILRTTRSADKELKCSNNFRKSYSERARKKDYRSESQHYLMSKENEVDKSKLVSPGENILRTPYSADKEFKCSDNLRKSYAKRNRNKDFRKSESQHYLMTHFDMPMPDPVVDQVTQELNQTDILESSRVTQELREVEIPKSVSKKDFRRSCSQAYLMSQFE